MNIHIIYKKDIYTFRVNHYLNEYKIIICVYIEVHVKSDHIHSGSNNNVIRTSAGLAKF